MTVENFTTFTEVDPNSKLTVISNRITFASLRRNEDAYVYKDFGEHYFNDDFTIDFYVAGMDGGASGDCLLVSLANGIDDWIGLINASVDGLGFEVNRTAGGAFYLNIAESYNGVEYTSEQTANATPAFMRFRRDESVGAFGTAYLYSYVDAARTYLTQASVSLALHKRMGLRYLYAVQSRNSGHDFLISGYVENLNLPARRKQHAPLGAYKRQP